MVDFARGEVAGRGVVLASRTLGEVACLVLERNGALSVIRSSQPIDPWLVADVLAPLEPPPRG